MNTETELMNKPGCTAWMKEDRFVLDGEYIVLNELNTSELCSLRITLQDIISDISAQLQFHSLTNPVIDKVWWWKASESLRIKKRMLDRVLAFEARQ